MGYFDRSTLAWATFTSILPAPDLGVQPWLGQNETGLVR